MRFALVLSSLVAYVVAQGTAVINTPESVLSCANHQITFSGGTAPYTILALPGGDTGAAALHTFANIQCSPFIWFVTDAAGTSIVLRLQDSAGASLSTAPFTIQPGTNNGTCVQPTDAPPAGQCTAASTATGAAGGGGGGGATTPAPTATGGGSSGTTPAPSGGSTNPSSTRPPSSSSSTGAGFSTQVGVAGAVAGIVAMGVAALA